MAAFALRHKRLTSSLPTSKYHADIDSFKPNVFSNSYHFGVFISNFTVG